MDPHHIDPDPNHIDPDPNHIDPDPHHIDPDPQHWCKEAGSIRPIHTRSCTSAKNRDNLHSCSSVKHEPMGAIKIFGFSIKKLTSISNILTIFE